MRGWERVRGGARCRNERASIVDAGSAFTDQQIDDRHWTVDGANRLRLRSRFADSQDDRRRLCVRESITATSAMMDLFRDRWKRPGSDDFRRGVAVSRWRGKSGLYRNGAIRHARRREDTKRVAWELSEHECSGWRNPV